MTPPKTLRPVRVNPGTDVRVVGQVRGTIRAKGKVLTRATSQKTLVPSRTLKERGGVPITGSQMPKGRRREGRRVIMLTVVTGLTGRPTVGDAIEVYPDLQTVKVSVTKPVLEGRISLSSPHLNVIV